LINQNRLVVKPLFFGAICFTNFATLAPSQKQLVVNTANSIIGIIITSTWESKIATINGDKIIQ